MNRILLYVVLPLVAAAAGILNLVYFWLDNLLRPSWPQAVNIVWYAAFPVIVVALILAIRGLDRGRVWRLATMLVVMIAAGFAPRIVDMIFASQQEARDQAEGADIEMEFQAAYLERSDEIAARTAAQQPYTAEEALAFLDFAADSDLRWRSLPDHTAETFLLVTEALSGGILDPNALTTPPTADSAPKTVTLAFYEARIRPGSPSAIRKHDWDLLQILVQNGADLSAEDASPLRADLAKTVIAGEERFIRLE